MSENPEIPGLTPGASNGPGPPGLNGGAGGADGGASAHPPVNIEDEVRSSFLDYSMSVIVSRALPDVRDGLKPVHRRILYAMHDEGLQPNRPFMKSAGVVGEVIKHYHPHGESAIYDAMVRMAQTWSLRYPLVDGQGNFGSVDGDPPGAYRYTEARLQALATELLRDIDRETVDFAPNFDGSVEEPSVLPARFPNLLANGSQGIAVGMATNVPPHNLAELATAVRVVAENPNCSVDDLLAKMPGPDFPTGALICGSEGIRRAYTTGRGQVVQRGRAEIEEIGKGQRIVITEIPYLVNKASMVERIADLVREGRVDGVSDLRDESDRDGIRVVVDLRQGAPAEVILNQLYKLTPLQTTFGVNLLALVGGRPRLLPLRAAIQCFLDFRREVVERRTAYELAQAEARAHILEGFVLVLEHLDEVIALIRAAADTPSARAELMARFELSERQAQAILEMRLRSLTAMERQRVQDELDELRERIAELRALLASDTKIMEVILEELDEVAEKFGDPRRSELTGAIEGIEAEDLIVEEDMVVTVSHQGYVKRNLATRSGRIKKTALAAFSNPRPAGIIALTLPESDELIGARRTSGRNEILLATRGGKAVRFAESQVRAMGRSAAGVRGMTLSQGDEVVGMEVLSPGATVLTVTQKGYGKRTSLDEYRVTKRGGQGVITIRTTDRNGPVIGIAQVVDDDEVMLITDAGQVLRCAVKGISTMGRATQGVRRARRPSSPGAAARASSMWMATAIWTMSALGGR